MRYNFNSCSRPYSLACRPKYPLRIVKVTPSITLAALDLHQTRSLSYYDALVVAAAQTSGCTVLYSEGMNADEVIGGVRIVNPFVAAVVEI